MVSQQMIDKLNDQVKFEWESEYLYMAIAAWCYNNNYDGFGTWFMKQASEEREHGMKILRYINEVDGDIVIPSIETKQVSFSKVEETFQASLAHELKVTARINDLVSQAHSERDHATTHFLQWYVGEQVEEEATVRGILAKLERINGSPSGLFYLEAKLAERA